MAKKKVYNEDEEDDFFRGFDFFKESPDGGGSPTVVNDPKILEEKFIFERRQQVLREKNARRDANNVETLRKMEIETPREVLKRDYEVVKEKKKNHNTPDKETEWLKNWINNRDKQIKNNLFNSDFGKDLGSVTPLQSKFTGKRSFIQRFKDYTNKNLDTVDYIDDTKKFEDKYNIPAAGEKGNLGAYYPSLHAISILDKDDSDTEIHEKTHASSLDSITDKTIEDILYDKKNIKHLKKGDLYDEDLEERTKYITDPKEILPRLMEFRHNLKLDPKKKYNLKDIKKMKNEIPNDDYYLFDLFNDESMKDLLNKVVSTDTDNKNKEIFS